VRISGSRNAQKDRSGEGLREAIGESNESRELLPRNSLPIVWINEAKSVSRIFLEFFTLFL
jgi:hypothetical protein